MSVRTRWATAAVSALVLLTILVIAGVTRDLDRAATAAAQSVASPALDLLASLHTFVALWPISALMAAALSLAVWRRYGWPLALAPLMVGVGVAIELVLKMVLVHPGPTDDLSRALWRLPVPQLPTPSSFPSGHALRITFFLVLAALWLRPGRAGWAFVALAIALSAFLRVYIGDHWASDVLGGVALGVAVATLTALGLRVPPRSRPSPAGSTRTR